MHPCPTRCTSLLIPKQAAIATSLFECPSVSRREFQRGHSQYVPAPSQSFFLTFPRYMRPCSGCLGTTSLYCILPTICRTAERNFAGARASVAHRDSVPQRKVRIPTVRRADGVSPSTNYCLLLLLMILHKAMNPEAEHLH